MRRNFRPGSGPADFESAERGEEEEGWGLKRKKQKIHAHTHGAFLFSRADNTMALIQSSADEMPEMLEYRYNYPRVTHDRCQ